MMKSTLAIASAISLASADARPLDVLSFSFPRREIPESFSRYQTPARNFAESVQKHPNLFGGSVLALGIAAAAIRRNAKTKAE